MMPPSDSGTPRPGSPISWTAASTSSGAAQASLAAAAAGRSSSAASSSTTSTSICLVLGRGQVEDAARLGAGGPLPCGPPARAGERATGGGRDPEAVAGGRVDDLLGLLAQADAVDQVALGQPVDGGDGEADGVARLAGRQPVATTRPEAVEEGHDTNVTPSYTLDQRPPRGAGHPPHAR